MNVKQLLTELKYQAVRSSGAGGQHVNKVSSKIELRFDVIHSFALSEEEKEIIVSKLQSKLNKDSEIIITCQESRSQHKNKEIANKKLLDLLKNALIKPKKRKKTKPSKQSIKKRLEKKAKNALKKENRKKVKF